VHQKIASGDIEFRVFSAQKLNIIMLSPLDSHCGVCGVSSHATGNVAIIIQI